MLAIAKHSSLFCVAVCDERKRRSIKLPAAGSRNSHDDSNREHRKRSAAGSRSAGGGRQAGTGEASADPEDDQSLIEIKDSVA